MSKTKIVNTSLVVLILSVLIGSGFAVHQLQNMGKDADFMLENGPWRVNPKMDLKNPKQRALIALVGLFALRETEVIYYTAVTDSNGDPLSSKHDYILSGSVPEARYWSYTLYGQDDFLIPNPDKIYAYNGTNIEYTPRDTLEPELENQTQATYTLLISNKPQAQNWLPSGDNYKLAITLRLYNASPNVYNNLTGIPLPEIHKVK